MPKENKYEQKSLSTDSVSPLDLEKQIGLLTEQVIDSYQYPTQTHALGSRLSQLHDLLTTGLLEDSSALTDAYRTCASRLLSQVLRDTSTSQLQLSSREIFASQTRQQTIFFQVIAI